MNPLPRIKFSDESLTVNDLACRMQVLASSKSTPRTADFAGRRPVRQKVAAGCCIGWTTVQNEVEICNWLWNNQQTEFRSTSVPLTLALTFRSRTKLFAAHYYTINRDSYTHPPGGGGLTAVRLLRGATQWRIDETPPEKLRVPLTQWGNGTGASLSLKALQLPSAGWVWWGEVYNTLWARAPFIPLLFWISRRQSLGVIANCWFSERPRVVGTSHHHHQHHQTRPRWGQNNGCGYCYCWWWWSGKKS